MQKDGAHDVRPLLARRYEAVAAEEATAIHLVELLDESLILPKIFFVRKILLRHSRVGSGELVEFFHHLVEPGFISLGLRMGVKKNGSTRIRVG